MPGLNQRIELKLQRGVRTYSFPTYVDNISSTMISVVHPRVEGKLIPLGPGDVVRLEYTVRGSARMAFETKVLALGVEGIPVLQVAAPVVKTVERLQERDFVRLEEQMNLTYTVLSMPDNRPVPRGLVQSYTRDISGNGTQIFCPEFYPSGTQLDIYLDFDGEVLHVVGEVIRHIEGANRREVWTGLRFIGLSEKERDMIIRFIFTQQLERRRKGLL